MLTSKAPGPATATLEVMRDGATLATLPLTLDQPDSTGRIRQLARLPVSTLPAGEYTLRLLVMQRGERALRVAQFQLVE